ncbi:MAG TPA: tetratricopeptide repeat protein [Mycobacteriales bacterium]|nr:tetratricopeptide repeat protein [Mycobacteriales bacterium]
MADTRRPHGRGQDPAGMVPVGTEPPAWIGRPPVYLTALVGREQEAARLRALLLDRDARLVTLTGPGGVGKTRLAVQAATDLDAGFDEVAFVEFAPVRDYHRVAARVAEALGVVESPGRSPAEALVRVLGPRKLLLLLDNFEHVLAAGPVLVDLMVGCPDITLLVTSRTLLRVSGEHVLAVPPLALPDPGRPLPARALIEYEAVRLLVERSAAVSPTFVLTDENAATVAQICHGLDGLPLAIELAAARMTVLSPSALLARLDRRLALLTDGAQDVPERLRTMRAGIAWSHDLLSASEQSLFRRLAVFAGGFGLSAAEFMCPSERPPALDTVAALVDQSLLQRIATDGVEPRLAMLETIGEFAMERLADSGEETDARRSHAAYFRRLAESAESGLRGPDQQEWRDRLEADLDNLRAALAWGTSASAEDEDAEQGLRLAGALWYFWFQRGLPGEGRRWLTRALTRVRTAGADRAQALLGAGTLAWRQGDFAAARVHLDESVALWRDTADRRGRAEALHVLGHVEFDQRDYAAAQVLFEESLAAYRLAADTLGSLPLMADLGLVAYHRGDYARAGVVFDESLAQFRRHGLKDRIAGALNLSGDLARLAGEPDRAAALYAESLELWRELRGTPGIASALHKLGQVKRSTGDLPAARAYFVQSLALQQELGNAQGIAECLAGLGGTAAGRPDRAARIFAASAALLENIGAPLAPADQAAMERDMAATRRTLGGPGWESGWAAGRVLSSQQAVELALADDSGSQGVRPAAPPEPGPALSRREREVTALIARGLSNREISAALIITEKTVGSHVEHIMTKLGLRSRTRIAVWAIEHGMGGSKSD